MPGTKNDKFFGLSRPFGLFAGAVFGFLGGIIFLSVVLLFLSQTKSDKEQPALVEFMLEPVGFSKLAGWSGDDVGAALEPFLLSCGQWRARPEDDFLNQLPGGYNFAGKAGDWREVCERAAAITPDKARQFFEEEFTPYRVSYEYIPEDKNRAAKKNEGLFTGYFEPIYQASHEKTEDYTAAIYGRPDDLIDVDLGRFRKEFAGKALSGRLQEKKLVPYADHEMISEEGLDAPLLGWMDPNDLLFLQIQGSGRLQFPDGEKRVGYAGKNGHAYRAVGRELVVREIMNLEDVSMQSIRQWLEAAPTEDAANLRHANKSYVFFRWLENLPEPELGPVGASGLQLTPLRSLAVDRKFYAMGLPVFVALNASTAQGEEEKPLARLMIAQDTGGAIKGAVRGDFYLGSGDTAGEEAGRFRREGVMFVLLPNTLSPETINQVVP
jgi:peptidoglycan lytic transglycosylase A